LIVVAVDIFGVGMSDKSVTELNEILGERLQHFAGDDERGARRLVKGAVIGAGAGGAFAIARKGRLTRKPILQAEMDAMKVYDKVKPKVAPHLTTARRKVRRLGKQALVKTVRAKRKMFFDDGSVNFSDENQGGGFGKKVVVAGGVGAAYAGARKYKPTRNAILKTEILGENLIHDPKKQLKKMRKGAVRQLNKSRIGAGAVGGLGKAKKMIMGAVGKKRFASVEEQQAYMDRAVELCSQLETTEFAGGYVNTKHGVEKEGGFDGHIRRNSAWNILVRKKNKAKTAGEVVLGDEYSRPGKKRIKVKAKAAKAEAKAEKNLSAVEFGTPLGDYSRTMKHVRDSVKPTEFGSGGVAKLTRKMAALKKKGAIADLPKVGMRKIRRVQDGMNRPVLRQGLETGSGYRDKVIRDSVNYKVKRVNRNINQRNYLKKYAPGKIGKEPLSRIQMSALELADEQLHEFQELGFVPSWRSDDKDPQQDFPHFRIDSQDKAVKLDNVGQAVVQYKLRNKSVNVKDDGSEKHSASMDILSIDQIPSDPSNGNNELSIAEKADRQLMQFASRSRDDGGRFSPGASVAGVGDFAAAKGLRKRRIQKGVVAGAAVAGLVGAVAGRSGLKRVAGRVMRRGGV
jgi:hypothetical protein